MAHRFDIGVFVGDGHYDCAPMVQSLRTWGRRLHHAQLYHKPFQCLLRVVFVLDADPVQARPVTLFATDPEMAPERIYCMYRDRFQVEFNFRDAKQHLGLGACQARTEARHHFHQALDRAAQALSRIRHQVAGLDRWLPADRDLRRQATVALRDLFAYDFMDMNCRRMLRWRKPQ